MSLETIEHDAPSRSLLNFSSPTVSTDPARSAVRLSRAGTAPTAWDAFPPPSSPTRGAPRACRCFPRRRRHGDLASEARCRPVRRATPRRPPVARQGVGCGTPTHAMRCVPAAAFAAGERTVMPSPSVPGRRFYLAIPNCASWTRLHPIEGLAYRRSLGLYEDVHPQAGPRL